MDLPAHDVCECGNTSFVGDMK
ncbi:MAG: hypothetical protein RL585_2321, partial [Pseudomonadota bacterium]